MWYSFCGNFKKDMLFSETQRVVSNCVLYIYCVFPKQHVNVIYSHMLNMFDYLLFHVHYIHRSRSIGFAKYDLRDNHKGWQQRKDTKAWMTIPHARIVTVDWCWSSNEKCLVPVLVNRFCFMLPRWRRVYLLQRLEIKTPSKQEGWVC